jgi:hypothetical protein
MWLVAPLRVNPRAPKSVSTRAARLPAQVASPRTGTRPAGRAKILTVKVPLLRSLFTLNRIVAHYLWEGRETQ